MADQNDPRWGGYVPWFLRYNKHVGTGDWTKMFSRLSQRLDRLLLYNEAGVSNLRHFLDWLETESLQRFTNDHTVLPNIRLANFFKPETLRSESDVRTSNDAIEVRLNKLRQRHKSDREYLFPNYGGIRIPRPPDLEPKNSSVAALWLEINHLAEDASRSKADRQQEHYRDVITERLTVLETLLRIVPGETGWKIWETDCCFS